MLAFLAMRAGGLVRKLHALTVTSEAVIDKKAIYFLKNRRASEIADIDLVEARLLYDIYTRHACPIIITYMTAIALTVRVVTALRTLIITICTICILASKLQPATLTLPNNDNINQG
eukprot:scaffold10865_cov22-Prasinocladus_malaysianus.AAC.1